MNGRERGREKRGKTMFAWIQRKKEANSFISFTWKKYGNHGINYSSHKNIHTKITQRRKMLLIERTSKTTLKKLIVPLNYHINPSPDDTLILSLPIWDARHQHHTLSLMAEDMSSQQHVSTNNWVTLAKVSNNRKAEAMNLASCSAARRFTKSILQFLGKTSTTVGENDFLVNFLGHSTRLCASIGDLATNDKRKKYKISFNTWILSWTIDSSTLYRILQPK